jgi:hypothetical protein
MTDPFALDVNVLNRDGPAGAANPRQIRWAHRPSSPGINVGAAGVVTDAQGHGDRIRGASQIGSPSLRQEPVGACRVPELDQQIESGSVYDTLECIAWFF